MSEDWQPLSDMSDPGSDIHALLWCRLKVKGHDQTWWTKWKCLRGAWIHWTGTGVNGSPSIADNWYIPTSSQDGCRVEKWEISHWMPVPEGPTER